MIKGTIISGMWVVVFCLGVAVILILQQKKQPGSD